MAQLGILLAMRGGAEEALLRQLHNHSSVTVARRCADGAEVLSAALAGVGDAAVIDAHLGVERSFVLRLRKAGVKAIVVAAGHERAALDRKSTRLNSSHVASSYDVFCLKKKSM